VEKYAVLIVQRFNELREKSCMNVCSSNIDIFFFDLAAAAATNTDCNLAFDWHYPVFALTSD
jgi:hypothetical protein